MDQTATKETQNYIGSIIPGIQQHELCDAHPHIPFNLSLKGTRIITAKNAAEAKDVHQKQHRQPVRRATGDAEGRQHPGGGGVAGVAPSFPHLPPAPWVGGRCRSDKQLREEATLLTGPQSCEDSCEDASLRVQQALQVIPVSAFEQNWFRAIRVSPELGINPFSPRCLDT